MQNIEIGLVVAFYSIFLGLARPNTIPNQNLRFAFITLICFLMGCTINLVKLKNKYVSLIKNNKKFLVVI